MTGMYVCYWYVCMSGETYIPRKLEVCMYVKGMYVCLGKQTYLETRGMYVCMLRVCMHVWGNIHTLFSEVTRYLAGIPCLPLPSRYVCMYVSTKIIGMYVWGSIHT